ncbi:zeta toxin family protein [Variovorax sp. J22R133]|uniref:zeta toxin family protein n=1 Tax=Variovorax brevis TaxID=3053503 RepID=UPI00257740EC|nr:zeta toxin family protein [Variovorax sp. J22R133]MDM0116791.1 zeta toxin family protein [Variovorax sp. J22R133]
MEHRPIIRFRIDREIARRAQQMARARGMELPDVMRMMVTRAVRDDDFPIDLADDKPDPQEHKHLHAFEPRYWGPFRNTLDAELAIALLRQSLANASARASTRWDQARSTGAEQEEKQFALVREEALRLLADFDVLDMRVTGGILARNADTRAVASESLCATGFAQGSRARRSVAGQESFVARCCIPDVVAFAASSPQPAAMVVLGQPGAGVSVAAALLGREMRRTTGPAVTVSKEWIRAYGAGLGAANVRRWLGRTVDAARERRLHLILEDEMDDPPRTHRLVTRLRQDGYVVQVVGVCVRPQTSRLLMLAARDALWRQHGLEAEFVTSAQHDKALADLRAMLEEFEKKGHVDGLRVIARDARQLFENRMAGDDWLRTPRAVAILDKEQSRALSDKDAVQGAMCWETLSHALAHDPAVPREVASQVLAWRGDAVRQCEASEARGRLLQWAHEGAAFRKMDRFAFEAAFPHHARAAAMMGEAVIEAEKHDEREAARFLDSARENIAQRIERGDMARIAARFDAPQPLAKRQ